MISFSKTTGGKWRSPTSVGFGQCRLVGGFGFLDVYGFSGLAVACWVSFEKGGLSARLLGFCFFLWPSGKT